MVKGRKPQDAGQKARGVLEKRVRQRTAELLASQQLLRGIVESSDDAIISKTLEGVITSWNSGAE